MNQTPLAPTGVVCLLLAALLADPAAAQQCGDNSPATPVPQSVDGQRLWPPSGFRPAQAGQRIPDQRDSTDYLSLTIAGQQSGHELFQSLALVGDSLYVSYNAGFSIWDISDRNAANPARRHVRDGYVGGFPVFPRPGEATHLINGIGAAAAPDGSVVVGVGAASQVGTTVWRHTGNTLDLVGHVETGTTHEVRVAEVGGHMYVFAAQPNDGILVIDGADATLLGSVPDGPSFGRYLDVMVVDDVAWLLAGGSLRVPPSLWALPDPSRPETAVEVLTIDPGPKGLAFWRDAGRHYLAMVRLRTVEIFEIDHCLRLEGCTDLGPPVWKQALDQTARAVEYLSFSRGPNGAPFLYYGFEASGVVGERKERLWDLSDLARAGRVTEITDGGGSYVDACGNRVDYWGHYHDSNGSGFRNVVPRQGLWRDRHFYRTSIGLLDVHTVPAQ